MIVELEEGMKVLTYTQDEFNLMFMEDVFRFPDKYDHLLKDTPGYTDELSKLIKNAKGPKFKMGYYKYTALAAKGLAEVVGTFAIGLIADFVISSVLEEFKTDSEEKRRRRTRRKVRIALCVGTCLEIVRESMDDVKAMDQVALETKYEKRIERKKRSRR